MPDDKSPVCAACYDALPGHEKTNYYPTGDTCCTHAREMDGPGGDVDKKFSAIGKKYDVVL